MGPGKGLNILLVQGLQVSVHGGFHESRLSYKREFGIKSNIFVWKGFWRLAFGFWLGLPRAKS